MFLLRICVVSCLVILPALFSATANEPSPDYNQLSSWVVLPKSIDKKVDLNFMHPTTYFDTKDGMNAALDNPVVNKATKVVAGHQAGVFSSECNLFAPRYRQASIADQGKSPVVIPGALGVNPLSWTVTENPMPAELNRGAMIRMPDDSLLQISEFTGAKWDKEQSALVIPLPEIDKDLNHNLGPGVYHGYDYDFFYENLVQNVKRQCKTGLDTTDQGETK